MIAREDAAIGGAAMIEPGMAVAVAVVVVEPKVEPGVVDVNRKVQLP